MSDTMMVSRRVQFKFIQSIKLEENPDIHARSQVRASQPNPIKVEKQSADKCAPAI